MPIPGNHTIITLDEVLQIAAKEAKEALQEFTGTFKYPDWCPKLEAVVVWDHDDGPTATLEVHVEVVGE